MKKKLIVIVSVMLVLSITALAVFAAIIIRGDLNGDGRIDTKDIVIIAEKIKNGQQNTLTLTAADIDNDGAVTISDAKKLQDIYLNTSAYSSVLNVVENGSVRSLALGLSVPSDVSLDGDGDIVIAFGISNSGVDFAPLYDSTNEPVVFSAKTDTGASGKINAETLLSAVVEDAENSLNVPIAALCKDSDITFIARVMTLSANGEIANTTDYKSIPSQRTVDDETTARISMQSYDMLDRINYSLLPDNFADGDDNKVLTADKKDVGIFWFPWLGDPTTTAYNIYDIVRGQVDSMIDPATEKPYTSQVTNYQNAILNMSRATSDAAGRTLFKANFWGRSKDWNANSKQHYDDNNFSSYVMKHYWSQPLWGYYYTKDQWAAAKQIELFINAGIDYLAIDATNGYMYSYDTVTFLDVLKYYQDLGWKVPKILLFCGGDGGSGHASSLAAQMEWYEGVPTIFYKVPTNPYYIDNDIDYTTRNMADFVCDAIFFNPRMAKYSTLWYHLPNDPRPALIHSNSSPAPVLETKQRISLKVLAWPGSGTGSGGPNNQSFLANGTEQKVDNVIPWMEYHRPQWLYDLYTTDPITGNIDKTDPAGQFKAMVVSAEQGGRNTGQGLTAFWGLIGKYARVGSNPNYRYNNEINMGRSYYSGNTSNNKSFNQLTGYFNAYNTAAAPSIGATSSDTFFAGMRTAGTRQRVSYYGFNMEDQMRVMYDLNPNIVTMTGWNSWTVDKHYDGGTRYGTTTYYGVSFPDSADLEYSGDLEPMKDGCEDTYYLQMTRGIRDFKLKNETANEIKPMLKSGIIFGESNFTQWADKGLTYRSFENEFTEVRNHRSMHVGDPSDGRYSFTDIGWQDEGAPDVSTLTGGGNQIVSFASPWYRPQTPEVLMEKYGIIMKTDPNDWDMMRPFLYDASGRNNIIETKVTYDDVNVYFYVKTRENITAAGDASWMNLLISTNFETEKKTAFDVEGVGINTNTNPNAQPKFDFIKTADGFGNYQFIINQSRNTADGTVSVERFTTVGNFNARTSLGDAKYEISGNEMHICIPRTMLGLESGVRFAFKWTDNVTDMSDVYESYYKTGNAAPIGRLNYYFNS